MPTGHYDRGHPPANLFVRQMPAAIIERLGKFCIRNRVSYREALVAIIPAGIKALTATPKGGDAHGKG